MKKRKFTHQDALNSDKGLVVLMLLTRWRRGIGRCVGISVASVALFLALGSHAAFSATFGPIADGDVTGLIDAIEAANANGEPDTIILATNGTYSLSPTADARIPFGTEGLPGITSVITIQGNGSVIERDPNLFIGTDRCNATSDSPIFRIIWVLSGEMMLQDVTIQNGCAVGAASGGGGIRNNGITTLTRSTVRDNAGVDFPGGEGNVGGGIFNSGSGGLTLTDSTVRGNNVANGDGGGIYNSGSGGLTLIDSTVSDNTASDEGGGILNDDAVTLINSTVSGNRARSGGGIWNEDGAPVELINSTITNNNAQSGGGIFNSNGSVSLNNTVIAAQVAGVDCLNQSALTSNDFNLDSDGTCNLTQPNDLPNTDPALGPLADNGGPTETHALLRGSPAIDAGEGVCTGPDGAPLTTDQRGEPRPVDGNSDSIFACDIGAFELQVEPPPLVDLSGTIEAPDGTDICAMVLASGQYTFSCNPVGVFSLTGLPQETDGTVKRQIYAHGFFPKINVLPDSTSETVVMTRLGDCPNYNIPYEPAFVPGSAGEEIYIAGEVFLQNSVTPICAVVLANGQAMFSCDGTGSYLLNIPLDNNGQFKLQVYADGFAPSIRTFDEFKTTNIVRMARAVECQ